MEIIINKNSLPFSIYVTPFYFENQPINEIHFLVELHDGEAFCCKRQTIDKSWQVTLSGSYPTGLQEITYEAIGHANPKVLLRELVHVDEL